MKYKQKNNRLLHDLHTNAELFYQKYIYTHK